MQSLQLRAHLARIDEAKRWGGRVVPPEQVDIYLSGAMRGGVCIGPWLANENTARRRISWCAASIGWAFHQVGADDPECPLWRAGALEMRRDGLNGESWRVVTPAQVKSGDTPSRGAVAVYTRGKDPSRGFGHVETLDRIDGHRYWCLGGNERGGRWYLDYEAKTLNHPRLLCFLELDSNAMPVVEHTEFDVPDFEEIEPGDGDDLGTFLRGIQLHPDWEAVRAARDEDVARG